MTTAFASDRGLLLTVKKQPRPLAYDPTESQAPLFAHKLLYGVVADCPSDFGLLEVLLLSSCCRQTKAPTKKQPQVFLASQETFWLRWEGLLFALFRASQAKMHADICPAFSYGSNHWVLQLEGLPVTLLVMVAWDREMLLNNN